MNPFPDGPPPRDVFRAMWKLGGSFVSGLGAAGMYADAENAELIRATWPEYWRKYSAIAALTKEQPEEKP